jgi:hypothetical protein
MQIATRKEIIGLNEGAVCIDHCKISVTYITKVNKTTAMNVSPNIFRILASYVTAPPTLITLRKKTCNCSKRNATVFDTAGEEVILVNRKNCQETFYFSKCRLPFFLCYYCLVAL